MVGRKHEPIVSTLARDIRAGRIAAGDRLPGEADLARRFAVSRGTVRAALAELNDDGLIVTRTGRGSYATYDGHRLVAEQGWGHALACQGIDAPPRVLVIAREPAPDLAGLGLDPAEAIRVDRVRRPADGPGVSYERSRVPATGVLADLPTDGLLADSLTATLERAGLRAHHGRERVSGHALTDDEAAVLGRHPGEWFLLARRTSFDAYDRFVEQVESLLDPAHFELDLDFVTGP